ncbi:MAG: NAD-dependent epimerase/dehydratase family protein [bacterium]
MTRRVLVTGGAGFIGSHVCEVFLTEGWTVDILDDLSSGKRENIPAKATLHLGDIRSAESAELISGGNFDAIVHLAAQIDVRRSVEEPAFDAGVNILGTLNILEAIRRRGSPDKTRVVFSSTGGAIYGDLVKPPTSETEPKEPDSPYAISKLAVEYFLSYYARIHGFKPVTVRFGNVYGPRQDPHGEAGVVAIFCGRILKGTPLTIFGDGEQTRDYVHVADVAQAIYVAATAPLAKAYGIDDRAFNIGTGTATSVVDLTKTLLAAAGATTPIEFAPKRPGELLNSCLAVEKARTVLGWQPRFTLAEGLADTFRWFAGRANATHAT